MPIAGGPGFPRTRIGSVAVSAQSAAIDPGIGDCVEDLVACAAEKFGRDSGGSDSDQQHGIDADAVEGVLEREDALDFVSLNHRRGEIAHKTRLLLRCSVSSADEIPYG